MRVLMLLKKFNFFWKKYWLTCTRMV